jgi:hypothetical protein
VTNTIWFEWFSFTQVKKTLQMMVRSHTRKLFAWKVCLVCMGAGDDDKTMIWLNKASDARVNPSILLRPTWDPLRPDTRLKDLMGHIGLAA